MHETNEINAMEKHTRYYFRCAKLPKTTRNSTQFGNHPLLCQRMDL
jgi:hypothetical protein